MKLFGKRKWLLEWQKAIIENSPNKLLLDEIQLRNISAEQVNNDLRIMQDCANIVNSTRNPEIYFARFHLLQETALHLTKFEKYIPFSGASPTETLLDINLTKQKSIHSFLIRYFDMVCQKANKLKTQKGKSNQYKKFYESLTPYFFEMNDNNRRFINDCMKKVNLL